MTDPDVEEASHLVAIRAAVRKDPSLGAATIVLTKEQIDFAEQRGVSAAELGRLFVSSFQEARRKAADAKQEPIRHGNQNPAGKVAGYTDQSDEKVALVNEFKADEERLLRKLDEMDVTLQAVLNTLAVTRPAGVSYVDWEKQHPPKPYDGRWLAIGRTHLQEAFMSLNRAVFQPQRIKLPEDDK